MLPRMSSSEISRLREILSQCRAVVEYGCGGSTHLALACKVQHIWSVETDEFWIEKLLENQEITAAASSGQIVFLHADIGPTGKWGHPIAPYDAEKIRRYPQTPWQFVNQPVDLVLVDGRFRAACLAASLFSISPECRIALHDVSPRRPSYEEALQLLDVEEQVDTLVIGRRRKGLPIETIEAVLKKFSMVSA
jgi:hypothetical protein